MNVLPDKALAKLLNYDQYKKDVAAGNVTRTKRKTGEVDTVTDENLYYSTIQKLISQHATPIKTNSS